VPAVGPTSGSAIALSADGKTLVVANRDSGSVSVLGVEDDGGLPLVSKRAEIAVGAEPWQVAIDGCSERAYVILRKDQKVVEIVDLPGTPAKGREVATGSEPTGIVMSPGNASLYVANWVEGTVSVIDAARMSNVTSYDLNEALIDLGLLGASVTMSRPALAHPRSLAMTNDGDADDSDERLFVTEFFAQRSAPEATDGSNVDVNWVGVVYQIEASDGSVEPLLLSSIVDTGFVSSTGAASGCFPNQLQSISIAGDLVYVTSICASPRGPVGLFQKDACTTDSQCGGQPGSCFSGSCKGTCTVDADCGGGAQAGACDVVNGGACKPIPSNIKAMTHPVVHVLDPALGDEASEPINLNELLDIAFAADPTVARRYPLVANELAFVPGTGDAYITANGTDAVFQVSFDLASGAPTLGTVLYADLAPAALDTELAGHNPVGLAVSSGFAFVANDVTRNVTAIDLATLDIAGLSDADPRVSQSADLPTDPVEQSRLRGKRFFNTGLDRWSLGGQGWGSCQSCHFEGLSDNITWYFARGPRQSTSLDGSFASDDPTDQRIFNWTAVFDEIHDFENVARGLNGAVGAIVSTISTPPVNADRVNLASASLFPPAGASGLNGSAEEVSDTVSVLHDWDDIEAYIQNVRSPRAPVTLAAADVAAGQALYQAAQCAGCHGGAKWTVSQRFYAPAGATNEALLTAEYETVALAAGFPEALMPATPGFRFMRSPNPKNGALDQIQCVLRPVGTFAVSPTDVNVVELKQDMVSTGQGAEINGNGFNVPSILGTQVGAPFFHAGNARTLEELLSTLFDDHHAALAPSFAPSTAEVRQLVMYLLSIDEATPVVPLPALGPGGGDLCAAP
jgi:hypothetical protein